MHLLLTTICNSLLSLPDRAVKRTFTRHTWSLNVRFINGSSSHAARPTTMAALRLVQVQANDETELKVCAYMDNNDSVADITVLDPSIPRDMRTFLEKGETAMAAAARYRKWV